MRRRLSLLLAAAMALSLCACGGPAGEDPSSDVSAEPSTSQSLSPVYSDWSQLEPYQPERGLYSRYYDEPVDRLLAVEGGYGGQLIPFAGQVIENGWWDEYRYGLATADGTLVCDPVYDSISWPSRYDPEAERWVSEEDGDVLVLWKTMFDGSVDENGNLTGERVLTLAAGDGSWVLEDWFDNYYNLSDGRLLLMDGEERFWICDRDGTLTPSPLAEKLSQLWGDQWRQFVSFADGVSCVESAGTSSGCWLVNALTGEVVRLPDVSYCMGWYYRPGPLAVAQHRETNLYGYLDRHGNWAIPPQFSRCDDFEGDFAQVNLVSGELAVIDRSGAVVLQPEAEFIRKFRSTDGSRYYLGLRVEHDQYKIVAIYDQNFTPIPDHPIIGRVMANTTDGGHAATREGREEERWTFWDQSGAVWTVETYAQLMGEEDDGRLRFYARSGLWGLYDPEAGRWVIPMEMYDYILPSSNSGVPLYGGRLSSRYSTGERWDVLNADGDRIARVDDFLGSSGGLILALDGGYSGFLDMEGNWVFRYPIRNNND